MNKCLNSVQLQGFINFPKYKEEKKYFSASICISEKYINKKANEEVKSQIFIPICAFREMAEKMKNLEKGCLIKVDGKINVSAYESEGIKKTFTKIIVNNFEKLEDGKKYQTNSNSNYNNTYKTQSYIKKNTFENDNASLNEDCPF